jgi:energy coupling factor transporter S component ThiW
MKNTNLKKLTLTALFAAIAVVGSLFSFPVFGAKCAPVQHLINVLCAIFLGPWYGLACAFIASFIRNALGLGTLLAFPGSMCGALLSGLLYKYGKKRWLAYIGEVIGTALIGGMLAAPLAYFILGNAAATLFTFVIPFLISTAGGSIIAAILCETMAKSGLLTSLKDQLEEENHGKSQLHDPDGCR